MEGMLFVLFTVLVCFVLAAIIRYKFLVWKEDEEISDRDNEGDLSADVDIEMTQNGTLSILQGSAVKLSATINYHSTKPITLHWQKIEDNVGKDLPVQTAKYSGSSCDLHIPTLTINDIDKTDAGVYRLEIRRLTEVLKSPEIVIDVLPGLSCEENNFIRIFLLCQKIGTESVRHYFDRKMPPSMLMNHLNSSSFIINRRFTAEQINRLFPGPSSFGKSADFDFTLLYSLIRNTMATIIPPPTQQWGNQPQSGNITEEDDIERIRQYRNEMSHNTEFQISDFEFNTMWSDMSQAVSRLSLGSLAADISELKGQTFNCTYKTKVEKCIKDIKEFKDDIEAIKKDQSDLRENIKPMKDDLEVLVKQQSDLQENIKPMKGDLEVLIQEHSDQHIPKNIRGKIVRGVTNFNSEIYITNDYTRDPHIRSTCNVRN